MVRRVFVRKLTSPFGEQFDNYSIENIEEFNEWSKQVEEKFSFPMLKRVFPIGIEISELRMEMFENRKFYFKADGYRLPTEAEWEYAARGGKKQQNFKYSGSDTIDEIAWYEENAEKIQKVATKNPNTLDLYDMSGNVIEWCWDLYGSKYYESSPDKNPTGLEEGNQRVIRGGNIYSKSGWYNTISSESRCKVWYRGCRDYSAGGGLGFRVVRSDK